MKNILTPILFLIFSLLVPRLALAHGFGARIDLPLPLNFYLIGAGVVVAISFILIGVFSKKGSSGLAYPRYNLLEIGLIRKVAKSRTFTWLVKSFFVFFLFLLVIAGFIGKQSAAFNITPTFVWVLFGVGMTYLSAFIGNIWQVTNPLKTLFEWLEYGVGRNLSLNIPWPAKLGVWPAFIGFVMYRWVENVYPYAAQPSSLAFLIILWSVVTFTGMIFFNKETWLKFGDPFNVFFGFLSRFSIIKGFYLRPPAVGLTEGEKADISQTVFILFMLSSIAFDGLKVTPLWSAVSSLFYQLGLGHIFIGTLGLLALLGAFFAVYLLFSFLIKIFSQSEKSALTLAYTFIFALLPIAIAYEVAHFLTLLFIEGQRAVYLISDPFGFGWNLFGTAGYKVNYTLINLKSLWNLQVALIVGGHIISVWIAHKLALYLFRERQEAMLSQYPMLVLMVFYTVFSLWIIAQPIVVGVE